MSDGRLIYAATADERRLAADWHGGMGSMLYAVASTGALSRGTAGYRAGRTDEEWSADLLAALLAEVREVAELAGRMTVDAAEVDRQVAEDWADTLAELAERCEVVGHLWSERANGYGWYLCERGTCRAKSADGAKGEDGEVDA